MRRFSSSALGQDAPFLRWRARFSRKRQRYRVQAFSISGAFDNSTTAYATGYKVRRRLQGDNRDSVLRLSDEAPWEIVAASSAVRQSQLDGFWSAAAESGRRGQFGCLGFRASGGVSSHSAILFSNVL